MLRQWSETLLYIGSIQYAVLLLKQLTESHLLRVGFLDGKDSAANLDAL
jgi:hypothetical protein